MDKVEQIDAPAKITTKADSNGAWHAVLAVEGVRTSDGREFAPGSLRWRTLPLPLMWQQQTAEKHQGAVVVGKITHIERRENEIHGWGMFDLGSEHGREAHRLVSEQIMRGVSIDAELMEIDKEKLMGTEDGEVILYVEEGRIGATTIVAFPAFPQAVIALDGAEIPISTVDGRGEALPSEAFEIVDMAWDGSSSRFDDAQWKKSTAACRGSDAPAKSDCFLPHHEPGGALNKAGLFNAAARFNQVNAPAAAKSRARSHLASHYRQLKVEVPKVLMSAALVASSDMPGPPAEWFENPELKGPTPLTVARNGRIYGHAALWNACHTGYRECMRPPRSRTSYAYFLTGVTFPSGCDCDQGVPTGPLVLGTRHANEYATPDTARRHYDHTGLAVADVTCGEDMYGIWVAGALRPGLSDAQLRAIRGSSLSGDWRYIGGNMELIGLLAVNTPGFPIPRVTAGIDSGVVVSLTAAGISDDKPEAEYVPTGADPAELLNELKKEVIKEPDDEKPDDTSREDGPVEDEEVSSDEVSDDQAAGESTDDENPDDAETDDTSDERPDEPSEPSVSTAQLLTELRSN